MSSINCADNRPPTLPCSFSSNELVRHKNWVWIPGMRISSQTYGTGIVFGVHDHEEEYLFVVGPENFWLSKDEALECSVDIDDSATVGCLLSLCRHLYKDSKISPMMCLDYYNNCSGWMIIIDYDNINVDSPKGDTYVDCIVDAIVNYDYYILQITD